MTSLHAVTHEEASPKKSKKTWKTLSSEGKVDRSHSKRVIDLTEGRDGGEASQLNFNFKATSRNINI